MKDKRIDKKVSHKLMEMLITGELTILRFTVHLQILFLKSRQIELYSLFWFTTTTLGTQNLWLLLRGGRCSEVGFCYEDLNWNTKMVVVVGMWSLFGGNRFTPVLLYIQKIFFIVLKFIFVSDCLKFRRHNLSTFPTLFSEKNEEKNIWEKM